MTGFRIVQGKPPPAPRTGDTDDRGQRRAEQPPAPDDAELVAAIKTGNPLMADPFCRRVWPQVDRTIRRLLGHDDGDQEDLAQLAIIELVKAIKGYRGDSALDTWVSAITAHVVYKHIRRRPMNRHISLDFVQEETLATSTLDGEGQLAAREVLARILGHMDAIGEKLSWTFVLHDVLGYGLRDAAQIMDISEAAAQSRLVRGRQRLHERIAEDPELSDLFSHLAARRDR